MSSIETSPNDTEVTKVSMGNAEEDNERKQDEKGQRKQQQEESGSEHDFSAVWKGARACLSLLIAILIGGTCVSALEDG